MSGTRSLRTALRVVYGRFCSRKSSDVRSSFYDCSSSSMLWSSLLLYAMLLGFLGTVNSSSSVTVCRRLIKPCSSGNRPFSIFCFTPASLGAKLEYYRNWSIVPRFRSSWISSVSDSSRGVMEINSCLNSAPDRFKRLYIRSPDR